MPFYERVKKLQCFLAGVLYLQGDEDHVWYNLVECGTTCCQQWPLDVEDIKAHKEEVIKKFSKR